MVAGRIADRIRLRDGESGVLLHEQQNRDRRGLGGSIGGYDAFDEQPSVVDWPSVSCYGLEKTSSRLYRLRERLRRSPASGASIGGFSFSRDFDGGVRQQRRDDVSEVCLAATATDKAGKMSTFGDQINGWKVGNREMISWKSTDGTVIEGVLHKPADFQAGRKYPLLVIVHGGPTGISRPFRVQTGGPYPMEQWLAKGALILEPNYRGSAGYGEKFRSLNVRNLGVGDAWDVLSGVDHLVAQGLADKDRLMSWAGARAATSRRSSPPTTARGSRPSRWERASRTG
jgi:dipeptidyl aminopeptidase/acylaminoacyl peptidase